MKMRSTNIAWILFFSALPLTVHAVDGVYEINQACVPVGCFPGDDPGFPVEITQAGSYRLTSSLMVPDANTTAVLVETSDEFGFVSVDLNGFEIAGPTLCDTLTETCTPTGVGVGIRVLSGHETVVNIRNGTVRGMGSHGVQSRNGLVESMRISHNGGSGISLSEHGIVRDCVVLMNGSNGIRAGRGVITGNHTYENLANGISCGGWSVVTDNIAFHNSGSGLSGNRCGYSNNTFGGNGGAPGAPQVSGNLLEAGTNVCSNDTICP